MNSGKYVLSQIMEFIPRFQFNQCVDRYAGHQGVRSFSCSDQFLALSFGQLSHRESLRDVVNCLNSQQEKLYHLGFSSQVKLPTLARANEKRDWRIYRDFAQILIKKARQLYLDDQNFTMELEGACYVIDATVIELCLSVFPWAKLKTIRAGVKVNLQMDLKGNIPVFFRITNAKRHDMNFLDEIEVEPSAHYILDRGYLNFKKLYRLHQLGAFFVIRSFKNLGFRRVYSNPKNRENDICCDQIIKLTHWLSSKKYPEKLRRIKVYDQETARYFVFLTNDFNLTAESIAELYRNRWQIELFFKWMKQHLKIKTFWGYSENAVKTQICIAICAYLLVVIAKKRLKIDQSLYEILQILNVTLLTKNPLESLFSEHELQDFSDSNEKQASLWDY